MPDIIDAPARQTALDPTRSFIVQAPAGSGKTELLIQRYLRLLSGVDIPERILTMTFTRKAAGEMKIRILHALERARDESSLPESEHERMTCNLARKVLARDKEQRWRLLDNPSRLKIQTIDSFCTALTRQMPVLSRMGGPLVIQENSRELYRETAQRILQRVESEGAIGDALRTILAHLDNSKSGFLKRLIRLLEKRDQWMTFFFERIEANDESRDYLEGVLKGLIESVLQEAGNVIPEIMARNLPPLAVYSAENCIFDDPNHPYLPLMDCTALPGSGIENLPQWKALSNLLLTSQGEFRKPGGVNKKLGFPPGPEGSPEKTMKNCFGDLLESLEGNESLRTFLHQVQLLPQPGFSDPEWEVLKATLQLLPELSKELRALFAERGTTDFTEISLAALDALGKEDDPTDLMLYLDYKIHHILVDEYQDTSFKQLELLKRLTAGWTPIEGRTLFLVGDPMQSIYRFRDAEVGLFLKTASEGVGDVPLERLTLKTNFRSQKKVVDWVNRCFSKIFPDKNNQDLGAIAYSPSEAFWPEAEQSGIVLHPQLEKEGEQEAAEVTNLIFSLRENYPNDSIAILVRGRSHLADIVRQFHQSGITFKAEEIDPLTTRPAILDLLALMRALLTPQDRISWLSILRAPWCGLNAVDLHRLCAGEPEKPVRYLLADSALLDTLSEEGRQRAQWISAVLESTFDTLTSTNFRDTLEGCWIALGGPACVDESGLQDVEVFFDKVSEVLDQDDLSNLQNFHRVLDDLYASPTSGDDTAVHIMTMHKAKGLEFDFVLLPGLGRPPRQEEKRLAYWMPHGDDLLIAPIEEKGGPHSDVYNFLARFDHEKDEFETRRLLYVAATRTRKQLHLFGHMRSNHDAPDRRSLLGRLWNFIRDDWLAELNQRPPAAMEPESVTDTATPVLRRLPADFVLPDPPPRLDTEPAAEIEEEKEQPEFKWVGSEKRYVGTVIHRLLKDISDQGLAGWNDSRINTMRPAVRAALINEGLSPVNADRQVETALQSIRNILSDTQGRWILEPHEAAQSEYPLTRAIGHRYVHKVIDRTFVADGKRWIIDYKTGWHGGSNLERFFEEEKKRYRAQLEHYAELIRLEGETRDIRLALYYPLHQRLLEF